MSEFLRKDPGLHVVVHGSVLDPSIESPNDIDAVTNMPETQHQRAMEVVRTWASGRGLGNLGVDLKTSGFNRAIGLPPHLMDKFVIEPGTHYTELWIPSPLGVEVPFEAIGSSSIGDMLQVKVLPYHSLASAIRAFRTHPNIALSYVDGLMPAGFSISTATSEYNQDKLVDGWDKYCMGALALRSAVKHVPQFDELIGGLPFAETIHRLATEPISGRINEYKMSQYSNGNELRIGQNPDGVVSASIHIGETVPVKTPRGVLGRKRQGKGAGTIYKPTVFGLEDEDSLQEVLFG